MTTACSATTLVGPLMKTRAAIGASGSIDTVKR